MNSYLISTAVLAFGLDGANLTSPEYNDTYGALLNPQQKEAGIQEFTVSQDFANGDFTAISKTMSTKELYAGDGSRTMASIRMIRF